MGDGVVNREGLQRFWVSQVSQPTHPRCAAIDFGVSPSGKGVRQPCWR
jgi:hypothetical protein